MFFRNAPGIGSVLARFFVYGILVLCGSNQFVLAQDSTGVTVSDDVVDPANTDEFVGEMYQIGFGWHPADLEGFPTDKFGLVDWVETLEQGLIKPRSSIIANAVEGVPFDMNVLMPSKTGMIAGAHFPHKIHTTWMGCDSCHVKIFIPLAGSNDLTMSRIVDGNACGVCHGKVAFPLNDCARCHVPNKPSDESEIAE